MTTPIPRKLMTMTTVDVETQVDGGSNANIFDEFIYVYTFTPCKGNILQVTEDCGQYEGVSIVLCIIRQDVIVHLYTLYLMPKNTYITNTGVYNKKHSNGSR